MHSASTDFSRDASMVRLAKEAGFHAAAVIPTGDIAFDASFRPYCAENLCGCYGANYSCPPDCGTPAEMERRIRAYGRALVLQSKWDIRDYRDEPAIRAAKRGHNLAALRVADALRAGGCGGLMAGASCCILCEPCLRPSGAPCRFPERRFSCLSAYCIYVKKLAERCGMEYTCSDGALALFSLYAFDGQGGRP